MERYTKGIVLGVGTFGKVLMATDKEVRALPALRLFGPLAGERPDGSGTALKASRVSPCIIRICRWFRRGLCRLPPPLPPPPLLPLHATAIGPSTPAPASLLCVQTGQVVAIKKIQVGEKGEVRATPPAAA